MKKFKGLKKLDEIKQAMTERGMTENTEEYDNGGDWIYYEGTFYDKPIRIALNTFNGWFFVYDKEHSEAIANHLSTNLDNEKWYEQLLNTIYTPA